MPVDVSGVVGGGVVGAVVVVSGVVGGGVVGVTPLVSTAPGVVVVVSKPPFVVSGLSRVVSAFAVSTAPVGGGAAVSDGAARPVSGGAWPVSSVLREQAANAATAAKVSNRRIDDSPFEFATSVEPGDAEPAMNPT
jgi:hypothetical protein